MYNIPARLFNTALEIILTVVLPTVAQLAAYGFVGLHIFSLKVRGRSLTNVQRQQLRLTVIFILASTVYLVFSIPFLVERILLYKREQQATATEKK